MTEIVVATLNVTFSEETASSGGTLKLEIDDRPEGLNNGDTSFQPGDTVGFWLFKDPNVTLETPVPISTGGGVISAGSASKEVDEFITFSNSESGSLGYPPSGSVSLTWFGRCYKIEGTDVTANTETPERENSTLTMPDKIKVAGILHAQYTTEGSLFQLRAVPEDILEVLIFAIGSIA